MLVIASGDGLGRSILLQSNTHTHTAYTQEKEGGKVIEEGKREPTRH
jgi:hypothetical protein